MSRSLALTIQVTSRKKSTIPQTPKIKTEKLLLKKKEEKCDISRTSILLKSSDCCGNRCCQLITWRLVNRKSLTPVGCIWTQCSQPIKSGAVTLWVTVCYAADLYIFIVSFYELYNRRAPCSVHTHQSRHCLFCWLSHLRTLMFCCVDLCNFA